MLSSVPPTDPFLSVCGVSSVTVDKLNNDGGYRTVPIRHCDFADNEEYEAFVYLEDGINGTQVEGLTTLHRQNISVVVAPAETSNAFLDFPVVLPGVVEVKSKGVEDAKNDTTNSSASSNASAVDATTNSVVERSGSSSISVQKRRDAYGPVW
ncbi:unnamed protein product [Amoebophrya sp. A25]|nr:unnamed protein product [Amoebophrya sp. A25]|eukprot:GSA25T00014481001.1